MQSRVYTEDEVHAMTAAELSRAIVDSAETLLGTSLSINKPLPYGGDVPSPHAVALQSDVPTDMYDRNSVWFVTTNGDVAFHPWVFRMGFVRALNLYESMYNRVNAHDLAFPRAEFAKVLRRTKNRVYQQNRRSKK